MTRLVSYYYNLKRSVYVSQETFIYLPSWVETALKRNGCNLDICLDYEQLRGILSLEDMSGLLAIQDLKLVTRDESTVSSALLSSWRQSAKGVQLDEINSTIVPLSCSKELREELTVRLSSTDSNPSIKLDGAPAVYYKVVDIGRSIAAFIVYPGFIDFVNKPENEYNVVVDQLKIFYVYLKSNQVSLLPLFKKYLLLLAAR